MFFTGNIFSHSIKEFNRFKITVQSSIHSHIIVWTNIFPEKNCKSKTSFTFITKMWWPRATLVGQNEANKHKWFQKTYSVWNILCVCLYVLMCPCSERQGAVWSKKNRVMKYLQRKMKHFLFEVGSLHRRLPECQSSSATLSWWNWQGHKMEGEVKQNVIRLHHRAARRCYKNKRWIHENKKESLVLPQWTVSGRWRLSGALSWSIKKLWHIFKTQSSLFVVIATF